MNLLEHLGLLSDSVAIATDYQPDLFAPVIHFVKRLQHILADPGPTLSREELQMLATELENFWARYRPTPKALYIPPAKISNTDSTIRQIKGLVEQVTQMNQEHWSLLLNAFIESQSSRRAGESKPHSNAMDDVTLLCSRFHLVAVQLRSRREDRPTLDVSDEYDVQDLLHSLLRIYFDDIRTEEWVPSYAGKATRMDFLLKDQGTVIEVKKTRSGLGAKEIGDQLINDIEHYKKHPNCKQLVCFVYDPENRVINPRGLETDLSRVEKDFDVVVSVVPKHE